MFENNSRGKHLRSQFLADQIYLIAGILSMEGNKQFN